MHCTQSQHNQIEKCNENPTTRCKFKNTNETKHCSKEDSRYFCLLVESKSDRHWGQVCFIDLWKAKWMHRWCPFNTMTMVTWTYAKKGRTGKTQRGISKSLSLKIIFICLTHVVSYFSQNKDCGSFITFKQLLAGGLIIACESFISFSEKAIET